MPSHEHASSPETTATQALAPLVVESDADLAGGAAERGEAQREVLAWGIQKATGLPRHISELTAQETGKACGIECVSCGRPLEAFNAGAKTWKHRPHFKHPSGTRREDCHIVAARMALVAALTESYVLELPARQRSGTWLGLSGTKYEAWRNLPSERVRVRHISYADRARALITLDDGRLLSVVLRGEFSMSDQEDGEVNACLVLAVGSDAELLSQLSPADLRARLTLLPDILQWRCHWQDQALQEAAQQEARDQARQCLDEWPQEMQPEVAGDRRRESLLHRLVREILVGAQAIDVPGWHVDPNPVATRLHPPVPAHRLALVNLRAESGLAGRVPDIQCAATSANPKLSLTLLAIEVVVHNPVSDEKLEQLRSAGAAVLAIDLSNWGGHITLGELRSIVVPGLECKRWLHHPLQAAQLVAIQIERELEVAWRLWRTYEPAPRQRFPQREQPPSAPGERLGAREALHTYGRIYRDAAIAYLEVSRFENGRAPSLTLLQERTPLRAQAWERLCRAADDLAELGAPGGADSGEIFEILARMLSIREDRGIGQARSENARATINHVWSEIKVRSRAGQGEASKPSPGAVFAVIAFQGYEIKVRGRRATNASEQVNSIVRASLKALEPRFLWDERYIPLLQAVFPEIESDLESLRPRMAEIADRARDRPGPAHIAPSAHAQKTATTPQAPVSPSLRAARRHIEELSKDEVADLQAALRRDQ